MQSTNHILLVQPTTFSTNPQTVITNHYHHVQDIKAGKKTEEALKEFKKFRDTLVDAGVHVTTLLGDPRCPDHVFPNWASTHEDRKLVYYSMQADNRRIELNEDIQAFLERHYDLIFDYREDGKQNLFLESTASLVMDRVNKIAYGSLSARTHEELAEKWAKDMGYDLFLFETQSHTGKPVYHTDLMIHIGTECVGIVSDAIKDKTLKSKVLDSLRSYRKVVEYDFDQMLEMNGNALELIAKDNQKVLMMSSRAHSALKPDQRKVFEEHYSDILHSPIPTLERYGGGSARCMMMELF